MRTLCAAQSAGIIAGIMCDLFLTAAILPEVLQQSAQGNVFYCTLVSAALKT